MLKRSRRRRRRRSGARRRAARRAHAKRSEPARSTPSLRVARPHYAATPGTRGCSLDLQHAELAGRRRRSARRAKACGAKILGEAMQTNAPAATTPFATPEQLDAARPGPPSNIFDASPAWRGRVRAARRDFAGERGVGQGGGLHRRARSAAPGKPVRQEPKRVQASLEKWDLRAHRPTRLGL